MIWLRLFARRLANWAPPIAARRWSSFLSLSRSLSMATRVALRVAGGPTSGRSFGPTADSARLWCNSSELEGGRRALFLSRRRRRSLPLTGLEGINRRAHSVHSTHSAASREGAARRARDNSLFVTPYIGRVRTWAKLLIRDSGGRASERASERAQK